MSDEVFTSTHTNPLSELVELRLEIDHQEQALDVICRLIFGIMHYEHRGRQYEVGVRQAHLRLALEGCETLLHGAFGENHLAPVSEETVETREQLFKSNAAGKISSIPTAAAGSEIELVDSKSSTRRQVKNLLPVQHGPNDTWKISPKSINNDRDRAIEGTAIPGSRLCLLRRKAGGNRLSVVGEVTSPRTAFQVKAIGGNALGKLMSEHLNKDAVVSRILERAIRREAANHSLISSTSTSALSRAEISEK